MKPNLISRLGIYLFLPFMLVFNPTLLLILYTMKKLNLNPKNPIVNSSRVNKTNYYYTDLFELQRLKDFKHKNKVNLNDTFVYLYLKGMQSIFYKLG